MSVDRSELAKAIFFEAVDMPVEERPELLADRCGADAELRAEVESLLANDDPGDDFMATPVIERPDRTTRSVEAPPVASGRRIGRYEIRKVIASGGMGTVYEAVQDHPHRLVALKVLRSGAASSQAMKRFQHEAEILGRLRHPNIAQIHDAGTFDEGEGAQPYFAMELVKGEPLMGYADARKLGIRERLALFAKVCDAVQYAHHKGIIHRDLKPDNILVDDFNEPKILDFGVARATDSDIQATTLRTDIGQLIGTVPYMSPEQVTGDPTELDTRSDVYSLGVVLYELMCGRLPHDLKNKAIPDAVRVIREDDPTPLSSVSRVYRGDVETIVAKALEKERERRYQSPADLAADVRHYLADEPIVARPASTFYQLRKFARRNKVLVTGVAGMFALLLLGTIGTTTGYFRSNAQAEKATAINEFLMWMISLPNPIEETRGLPTALPHDHSTSLADLLDEATAHLDTALAEWPLERASLHERFGLTYRGLNNQPKWRENLERAYELRRQWLGEDDPVTLATLPSLAHYFNQVGQHDEAERRFQKAAEGLERVAGTQDRRTLNAMRGWGRCLGTFQRRFDEAAPMLAETLATQRMMFGDDDPATLGTANDYLEVLFEARRSQEAEQLAREFLEICISAFGDENAWAVAFEKHLGFSLLELGDPAGAEKHLRHVLSVLESTTGYLSTDISITSVRLGYALTRQDRAGEAVALMRDVVDETRAKAPDDHMATLLAVYRLGYFLLTAVNDPAGAEPHLRWARDAFTRVFSESHPLTMFSMEQLGIALREQGKYQDAAEQLEKAMQSRASVHGENFVRTLRTTLDLADAIAGLGRLEEADRLYEDVIARATTSYGSEHGFTRRTKLRFVRFLRDKAGKPGEAEAIERELATAKEATESGQAP
jgi:non-specific serine/threonine protein kinase/serine/threonine-protein kinase